MKNNVSVISTSLLMLPLIFMGLVCTVFASNLKKQPARMELVWAENDGLRYEVYASSFNNKRWSEAVKVTDDNADNLHPCVDTGSDGDGRKWLVWTAIDQDGPTIKHAVFDKGQWSEPETIPSQLSSNIAPAVMVDTSNIPWVVWAGNDGDDDDIYFTRFIREKWEDVRQINESNDVPDVSPLIELSETKQPQVTWEGYHNGKYRLVRSTWDGKRWGQQVELEEEHLQDEEEQPEKDIPLLPDFVQDREQVFLRTYVN